MEDVIANGQTVQMAAVASSDPAIDAWLKADAKRSMKIGITGLKHMAKLSQETYAYSATVTLDGVRAFDASNTEPVALTCIIPSRDMRAPASGRSMAG